MKTFFNQVNFELCLKHMKIEMYNLKFPFNKKELIYEQRRNLFEHLRNVLFQEFL